MLYGIVSGEGRLQIMPLSFARAGAGIPLIYTVIIGVLAWLML
jgi:hypothetical protein